MGFSLMVESTFSQANSFNPSPQLVKQLRCCFCMVALTRRVALKRIAKCAACGVFDSARRWLVI